MDTGKSHKPASCHKHQDCSNKQCKAMGKVKPKKRLTSSQTKPMLSSTKKDKYAFENAGPSVSERGQKLVGRSIDIATSRTTSMPMPLGEGRTEVTSNAIPTSTGTVSEASVSGMTSSAERYNLYRFDETAVLKTYKKMLTLHLKDKLFRKLKFITNDEELAFSRNPVSICGFVCTNMRVQNHQWGEYWKLVQHTTKKMIEQQRTNATSAIKKGFKGK